VIGTLRAVKFLVMAPFLVAFLFAINLMTWQGHWWVQWAALGIGIAWIANLIKVIRAIVVAGGLAALGTVLFRNRG
jgi:hypothetical protein